MPTWLMLRASLMENSPRGFRHYLGSLGLIERSLHVICEEMAILL